LKKHVPIIVLGFLVLVCDTQKSNPLKQPEKFAEVYLALLRYEARDSLTEARMDSIIASHGMERKQFDKAVQHFVEHPEKWQEVVSIALGKLEEEQGGRKTMMEEDSLSSQD